MSWVKFVIETIVSVIKMFFGIDKPSKNSIDHPEPDIKVDDGKTDKERLKDLGL